LEGARFATVDGSVRGDPSKVEADSSACACQVAVPRDENEVVGLDSQCGGKVDRIVASQAVLFGQVAARTRDLRRDFDHVEFLETLLKRSLCTLESGN
jgi:hypothetical protein